LEVSVIFTRVLSTAAGLGIIAGMAALGGGQAPNRLAITSSALAVTSSRAIPATPTVDYGLVFGWDNLPGGAKAQVAATSIHVGYSWSGEVKEPISDVYWPWSRGGGKADQGLTDFRWLALNHPEWLLFARRPLQADGLPCAQLRGLQPDSYVGCG